MQTQAFKIIANQKPKHLLWILVLVVTILSFWGKGVHSLQEWDESRNGANAFEMLRNGDYINPYYNGELDTWNAKPPLMIWCIVASYKIFGFNEFALRFPATISTIIFFVLCFYTISLLENSLIGFLTCLLLISCKAIFGIHVGLTGDFDALLIVFLTASVYSFILYIEKKCKYGIILAAVFTGLAFYSKGSASLVLLPGLLLYTFLRREVRIFKDEKTWVSITIFVIIVSSWLMISSKYGKTAESSFYKSNSSIEIMFVHDTYRRLMSSDFEYSEKNPRDYLFFFEVLDAKLNLWNYMFYISLLSGAFALYKQRKNFSTVINKLSNRMLLLSFCLILPLSVTLSFATNKNHWYLAPLYMFIAFITVKGILLLGQKWKYIYSVAALLFAFTFIRQCYYIYSLPTETHYKLTDNNKLRNRTVIVYGKLSQDLLLYFEWLNVKIEKGQSSFEIKHNTGQFILAERKYIMDAFKDNFTPLENFNEYMLGISK